MCVGNKGSRAAFLVGINPELKGAPSPPPPHIGINLEARLIHYYNIVRAREMQHALAGVYNDPSIHPHIISVV